MEVMEYYNQAWDLMRQKDYDAIIELCTTGLAEYPDSVTILGRRAVAYSLKGEKEQSLADYTRMIALKPQDPDGWNSRGNLYHELGEYDKAIADYSQCIPLSPEGYGTYWSNRGISCYEKGDLDAALADLTTSIATWRTEDCTCWALYYRGLVWRKKGDLKKALADFRRSAAREPYRSGGADALFQAGYIWFVRDDPEKAIKYFSRAIKRRNDCADYWLARGVCYWNTCVKYKTGFWDEGGDNMDLAADDFTKAIECDPNRADAYFNRGMVHCSKARESHNLIKAIVTQKVTDNTERAMLLAQLEHIGGHDFVPQVDAMLRGLRSNRDEVDAIMASMAGLFADADAREAVEDLTRAIELDPDNADACYQRGLAYALLGERDKAIADYETTLSINLDHDKAAGKRDELLEAGSK
jgi:tetratricopeptide (TPR) repeat protein